MTTGKALNGKLNAGNPPRRGYLLCKKLTMAAMSFAALAATVGQWPKPDPIPREKGLYRSQIHRGGGYSSRPDNSLETFLWCWGLGFAPEADARLTKDGVAIAMHDNTFWRIGRGITPEFAAKMVKDLTWDEVRDVDTGSYLGAQYSTTRLATMEAVFAAMKGRPERLLYVDEKGAPPKLIAELADKFGVIEQTYYCSPNWRKVVEWRKIAPGAVDGVAWEHAEGQQPRNRRQNEIMRGPRKSLVKRLFADCKGSDHDGWSKRGNAKECFADGTVLIS